MAQTITELLAAMDRLNVAPHLNVTPRLDVTRSPRRRPRGPPPSRDQIINVAQDVVSTLKKANVDGCYIGSMGCMLFGHNRKPNDLDILCLTKTYSQESLKAELIRLNPRFYTVPSRNPKATYRVLWYYIIESDSCLKVDLLLPGTLDIPEVPLSEIDRTNIYRLPCAPMSHLLLLKLQGWIHHGEALALQYRQKLPQDEQDVNEMLRIARRRGLRPRTETYLPRSFISVAETRVKKYVKSCPNSKEDWAALGFEVS